MANSNIGGGGVRVFGTLGPACCETDVLKGMLQAGMDGVRLNLSHIPLSGCVSWLDALFAASKALGASPELIIDMQGPELRVGALEAPVALTEGERVLLGEGGIPVPIEAVAALAAGDELLLDDGKLRLMALDAAKDAVWCRVLRGGTLRSRKSLAITGKEICLPTLTKADLENLIAAASLGVTGVMQPFVRGAEDLSCLRREMEKAGLSDAKLYAKVENVTGLEHLPALIAGADELVIARGDLANAVSLYALPGVQKDLAKACVDAGRPFMVATELLSSMTERSTPTRAEVSDIFNAVLDGASSLIVTGETATGKFPVEVIQTLKSVTDAACRYRER